MEVLRGKIGRQEGLREALEIIIGYKSVTDGVLDIKGDGIGGRLGIAVGKYITGAELDSGESGRKALRRLLLLREGTFAFIDTEGEPACELRQSLGVDLEDLLQYVPDKINHDSTAWLFDPAEEEQQLTTAQPEPTNLAQPKEHTAGSAVEAQKPPADHQLLEMLHLEALRHSLEETATAAHPKHAVQFQSPVSGIAAQHPAQDQQEDDEITVDLPAFIPEQVGDMQPIETPQEEEITLDGTLVKQARKEAAAFLNKETRSATHLRLTPIAELAEREIRPEEARLVPEPFNSSPSFEFGEALQIAVAAIASQHSGLQALLAGGDDEEDLRSKADENADEPLEERTLDLAVPPAAPPVMAESEEELSYISGQSQAPAQQTPTPIPNSERPPSPAPLPRPPVPQEKQMAPQQLVMDQSILHSTEQSHLQSAEQSILQPEDRTILKQLVANARKTGPLFTEEASQPPFDRTGDAAVAHETPVQPPAMPAQRMASKLRSGGSKHNPGFIIFCVLIFVISCAITLLIGGHVTLTLPNPLH
jgi:hypothetical protein